MRVKKSCIFGSTVCGCSATKRKREVVYCSVCFAIALVCVALFCIFFFYARNTSRKIIWSWHLLSMSVTSHKFAPSLWWRDAGAHIQYGILVRAVCTNIIDLYG